MATTDLAPQSAELRLSDALLIYSSPASLFRRVEDTGAYGWTLAVLLGLVTLTGYVQVKSGLIGNLVETQTQKRLAEIEKIRAELVDRGQLREKIEDARKEGEFFKTMRHLQVLVLSPMFMLGSFLLTSAFLYAMVALSGRKPEYHTLMSVCVYPGLILLVAHVLRVLMMMYYRRIDMDTSLGMLADPDKGTLLVALDPFVIWYWVLVALGLTVTQQLSRRMAIVSCTLLCVVGLAMRVGMSYA